MDWETLNFTAMIVGYLTITATNGFVLYCLAALGCEADRSYRQVCRMERIYQGKGHRREWRKFLKTWRRDFCRDYHSITIRGVRLPHNPRKPIRRDW